jgi:hypothetical protein
MLKEPSIEAIVHSAIYYCCSGVNSVSFCLVFKIDRIAKEAYFELCLLLGQAEADNHRPIRLNHHHIKSRFDIHGHRAANDKYLSGDVSPLSKCPYLSRFHQYRIDVLLQKDFKLLLCSIVR